MSEPIKNILFITIDQWRFDFLGAHGFDYVKTPHLDNLAQQSTLFMKHYSVCAPCGPSRTSLLSGLYQHSHGHWQNGTPIKPLPTTLPLELRKKGIMPILMGYTDTTPAPKDNDHFNDPVYRTFCGTMAGFDKGLAFDDEIYMWIAHLKRHGVKTWAHDLDIFLPDYESLKNNPGLFYSQHPAQYPKELSPTAYLTDHVCDFLEGSSSKKPFMLHATILAPHPPYIAPAPYHNMYDPRTMPPPKRADLAKEKAVNRWISAHIDLSPNQKMMHGFKGNIRDMSISEVQALRATYAGMVSEVDDNIKRIMDSLESGGHKESTLIVITADHGDLLGDHYMQAKLGYWRESYHIPCIIHHPTLKESHGVRIDKFSESVDIMPTILDFVGADIPLHCQGASLKPLMMGDKAALENWRACAHYDFYCADAQKTEVMDTVGGHYLDAHLNVMVNDDYLFAHFSFLPPLLFDLRTDGDCLDNLAENPKHQAILLQFYQSLAIWRNRAEDKSNMHQVAGRKGGLWRTAPAVNQVLRPC